MGVEMPTALAGIKTNRMAIWVRAPTGRRRPGKGRPRPALTNPGGPVEPRYPDLWPVPVLLVGRSTAHPCAGLALGDVLSPRPTTSPDAVFGCCVILALLKRG